ncbi:MAG: hypothetical protein C0615_00980 [Desulfuromonas sp.]|nr:MAG: hypothetical protein C0615_00980 [Desulfuromonas sp.]
MGRLLTIILLVLGLALPALADESKSEESFWDVLRSKIEKVTPTKKAKVTTAVGGVRGSLTESESELYWKGKEERLEIPEEELELFNGAMTAATIGDRDVAIDLFESFVSEYPESALHEDSLLALKFLRVNPAEAPVVEEKTEPAETSEPQGTAEPQQDVAEPQQDVAEPQQDVAEPQQDVAEPQQEATSSV